MSKTTTRRLVTKCPKQQPRKKTNHQEQLYYQMSPFAQPESQQAQRRAATVTAQKSGGNSVLGVIFSHRFPNGFSLFSSF